MTLQLRSCGFVALLSVFLTTAVQADLAYVTSTATITLSAVGAGVINTTTGEIPFQGSALSLTDGSSPAIFGVMGIHRVHNASTGNVRIIVPSPSLGDLLQDSDVSALGQVTLEATFTATFTIDAGGLPAHTVLMKYGFAGLLGPAVGSRVDFDNTWTYTHSVSGLLGSVGVTFARTSATPGNFSPLGLTESDSVLLPAMIAGDLTVTGNIRMQVDDSPGDTLVTELGIVAIPEPSTWALLLLSGVLMVVFTIRTKLYQCWMHGFTWAKYED
jgi:hypothetical protein